MNLLRHAMRRKARRPSRPVIRSLAMHIPLKSIGCRAVAGCVLAASLAAIQPAVAQQGRGGPPSPPRVIVAEAVEADLVERIEALGTIRANESVEITSKLTDKIVAIHFEDGDLVDENATLVELSTAEERADLRAAEALLAERRKAYDRAVQLRSRNVAAAATLDEAKALMDQAQAQVDAVRARLEDHRIRAPFAGVMGLRNVSVGALVEPGDRLATLDDIATVKVDFPVAAVHLAALRPGLAVEATTSAFGDRVFRGEVLAVDTRVDPVTRAVVVRAAIANPDLLLRPGLLMQIDLLGPARRAVVVPESALAPSGREQAVFVLDSADGDRVRRRVVETGLREAGRIEVRDGLPAGELVVTHGIDRVRDGQPVTVLAIDDGSRPIAEILAESPGGEIRGGAGQGRRP